MLILYLLHISPLKGWWHHVSHPPAFLVKSPFFTPHQQLHPQHPQILFRETYFFIDPFFLKMFRSPKKWLGWHPHDVPSWHSAARWRSTKPPGKAKQPWKGGLPRVMVSNLSNHQRHGATGGSNVYCGDSIINWSFISSWAEAQNLIFTILLNTGWGP